MARVISLSGQRFGRLIVIEEAGRSGSGAVLWKCVCDCGQEIVTVAYDLRRGRTKSCGCLRKEQSAITGRRVGKITGKLYSKPYGEAAKNALLNHQRHQARLRKWYFDLTDEDMLYLFKGNCHYCNTPPSLIYKTRNDTGEFVYNGIDRVDNNYGYYLENVVSCCAICNFAKKTMTKEVFLDWVKRVYEHNFHPRSEEPVEVSRLGRESIHTSNRSRNDPSLATTRNYKARCILKRSRHLDLRCL